MIRRIAAALAAVIAIRAMIPRPDEDEPEAPPPDELVDFDLKPGDWFGGYLSDWMDAHNVTDQDSVTSGIAIGDETDEYIWATATPEWDAEWFHAHGYRFPRRWVPFYFLGFAEGEPGDDCRLRGL